MATGARRGAAAMLAVAALVAACDPGASSIAPSTTPVPATSIATTPVAVPSATVPAPPTPRQVATHTLTAIAGRLPGGSISVAVVNTRTGASFRWGERRGMWTGSVYKLLVLEALLLERQRADAWFTSYELADITAMIEQSNNKAGYRMFLDAGGSTPLAAAAKRLGLRHTHLGVADPALTTMDARDGITLLRRLVHGGPLTARSKAFVLGLMRNVQSDQRWGAGVVADRDTTFANKNGWMQVDRNNGPGEDDDGRWLVNSLGIIRVHGQQLLIAIFTKHDPDCYSGIRLVQKLARTIVRTVVAE